VDGDVHPTRAKRGCYRAAHSTSRARDEPDAIREIHSADR
jgi:hypothetical protein